MFFKYPNFGNTKRCTPLLKLPLNPTNVLQLQYVDRWFFELRRRQFFIHGILIERRFRKVRLRRRKFTFGRKGDDFSKFANVDHNINTLTSYIRIYPFITQLQFDRNQKK